MLIVIEGVDGAGKSTLALKLAHLLRYRYRHYPTSDIKQIPRYPRDAAYALDMVANPPSTDNMVVDRYYYSHIAYGGKYGDYLKAKLPKPNLAFLINISAEESYQRCATRGDDLDIKVEARKQIIDRYWGFRDLIHIPSCFPVNIAIQYILDTMTALYHHHS